jgi:hypothetical protein
LTYSPTPRDDRPSHKGVGILRLLAMTLLCAIPTVMFNITIYKFEEGNHEKESVDLSSVD